MNWKEYLELSEKTLSTQFHAEAEVYQRILHGAIGLCTEAGELLDAFEKNTGLDLVNIKEELGDIYWYLAILHRDIPGIERGDERYALKQNPLNHAIRLTVFSTELLDQLKKKIYYGKDFDIKEANRLVNTIEDHLSGVAVEYKFTKEDILETNINKLKARYGEKFSSDAAINRDLDTERKTLEE
jgi:hypothetical protein